MFSPKRAVTENGPSKKGKKGIISVQSGFGFLKPYSIVHFKIVWIFFALILDP